ncbi:MAG TPA: hypothetical protein VFX78_01830 [Candidatus Eisenbacteria bacterium]|nr:hypothetical protein [Candidatus Eisenbacteria bacterium]
MWVVSGSLLLLALLAFGCEGDDPSMKPAPPDTTHVIDSTQVTVNFTVTGAAGDTVNSGVSASGSFSFDRSIIPPSGGGITSPSIHRFHLVWDGTTWDSLNTTAGRDDLPGLVFDSNGTVTDFFVWGNPTGDGMDGSDLAPDDFWITKDGFVYHREGVFGNGVDPAPFEGAIEWSVFDPKAAAALGDTP